MSNHEEIVCVYICASVCVCLRVYSSFDPRFPYCFLAFPRGSTARRVVIVSLARVRLEPPPHLAFGLAATSRPDRFYTFVSPTLVRRASALTARRSCTRPALRAAHTTTAERIDLFFSSSPDVCMCMYTYVCMYIHIYTRLQCVCTQRDTRARGGDGGSRRKDEAGNKGRDPVRILLAEPYPGSSLCSAGCLVSFLGIKARRTIDRRLSRSFFPSFLGFARTRVKRPGSNSRSLCFITFGLFHEPLFTRTTFREGDL